jgi:hypothetical protein
VERFYLPVIKTKRLTEIIIKVPISVLLATFMYLES